jgi:Flp pilus assembly pilin Flp
MIGRNERSPIDTNELGTASVEYGLLISLVAGVVAVALVLFGPAVAALFSDGLDVLL